MKLVQPSFIILEQQFPDRTPDMTDEQYQSAIIDEMCKHIELCGRTCYKSTDKITESSARPFVNRMIEATHYAMLEHGTIYLRWDATDDDYDHDRFYKYKDNEYSKAEIADDHYCYVTTNYRVIIENGWTDDLKYICCPTKYHQKRYTVRYVANIQFYKDCTRHRVFSWAIESTRYCNYVKEKFGSAVSFILPCWVKPEEYDEVCRDLETIEGIYFKWINKGWQPQQASTFLPQATKAEVIMTGFVDGWHHFFDLRALGTTGAPHPQVKELAYPLYEEFKKREII